MCVCVHAHNFLCDLCRPDIIACWHKRKKENKKVVHKTLLPYQLKPTAIFLLIFVYQRVASLCVCVCACVRGSAHASACVCDCNVWGFIWHHTLSLYLFFLPFVRIWPCPFVDVKIREQTFFFDMMLNIYCVLYELQSILFLSCVIPCKCLGHHWEQFYVDIIINKN